MNIIFGAKAGNQLQRETIKSEYPKVCRARVVYVRNVKWVNAGDLVIANDDFSVESRVLHPNLSLEVIKDAVLFILKAESETASKTYFLDNGFVEVVFVFC